MKRYKPTKIIVDDILVAKSCSKCEEVKKLDLFPKQKSGLGGRLSSCKECQKTKNAKYRSENKERLSEYYKEYYAENKEKENARVRKWYQSQGRRLIVGMKRGRPQVAFTDEQRAERAREYNRKSYYKNQERRLAYCREYQRANRDKNMRYTLKRRAVKLLLQAEIVDTIAIKSRFNNKCPLSDATDIHLDHFIPIATGHGGTYEANMIPLGQALNQSKKARNPFEWVKERTDIEPDRWDALIQYIAAANDLTVEEYRSFVYWCFENPRSIEQITDDRTSIEIWKSERDCVAS